MHRSTFVLLIAAGLLASVPAHAAKRLDPADRDTTCAPC